MRYFSLKAARKTVLASLSLISPFSLAPMALASEAGQAPVEAAAEAYDGQNEIVVTARRRAETAQNVPVAISVVGAQDLEKTGNYSLAQIQQLVPSLQITSANPRNTNINIRGLGANSSIAVDGLEYGVGFYLDGVYYGRPGQSQFDLVDLQQIEVLHGPQGTLFGKNTTSGAINATSKAPSFVPEVTAEISGGTYDYHQFRASVSGPIIADKLAVRLSVADTHRGGFLTNLYDGEKAHDYDNFNVRGQLLFRPVEDVSIRLIGDYANQKQAMMLNLIDGYYTHFANGTPIANNVFDRAAYAGYDLPQTNAFDRQGNSNSPYQSHMKSYGASAQVDWDLPFATLTSITAYRWWDSYPRNDVDGTPLSSHTKGHQDNFQRQFSQELRIASTGRNQIDYVAGLYYYWQKIRGYSQVQTGKDFVEWNLNPANFSAPLLASIDAGLTDLQMNSYSDPEVRSYAAFGQLDWNISPDFTITAGLRFTHEAKSGIYRRQIAPESGGDRSLLPIGMQNQFQVTDLSFGASLTDNALAGLLSANYKITPDAMIYASYSRGSKSGGLNLTPSLRFAREFR